MSGLYGFSGEMQGVGEGSIYNSNAEQTWFASRFTLKWVRMLDQIVISPLLRVVLSC